MAATTTAVAMRAAPPPQPAPRRRATSWARLRARWGAAFTVPFFLGFAFTFVVPVVWALGQSLFTERRSALGLGAPTLRFAGVGNYARALGDAGFWVGMVRVALFAVIMVPLGAVLALVMALLVDQARERVARVFRFAFLIPHMIPGIVATLIWIYLYSPQIGPLTPALRVLGVEADFFAGDTVWVSMGNLMIWGGIGFTMLVLYGSLKSVPAELFDAARLDGASDWQIAWHIKIPHLRGTLVLTTMLSIIGTLQLFNEPLLFKSVTPETITNDFTPVQAIYTQAFGVGDPFYAAALSVLLAVIVAAASALFYRLTNREPVS